jgi:glutamine cyclotransferase
VLGWIDLAGLLPAGERTDPGAVLNGIAYDAEHDRLFVTGKLWPRLFEIKVIPGSGQGGKSPNTTRAAH